MKLLPRYLLLPAALVLMCVSLGTVSHAASQNDGSAIAQGFSTDGTASNFVTGALVSVKNNNSRTVQLANSGSANRLAGVVSQDPLLALGGGKNQIQVVLSGSVSALVSDINGEIRAGDKITASPIEGVGMLATTDAQIVGTAQASLNTKTATRQTVNDRDGEPHTVHIGRVPLQVNVSYYQAPTNTFLPPFLQELANQIAGRPVSIGRILIAGILILLAFVSVSALLYTSVRSGIISIGRNPLAASAIRRGLLQVALAAVLILIFAVLAVYVTLTV